MFMQRLMGVFKLNAATFEDVEHDASATGQAALVVGIVALLSALGSGLLAATGEQGFLGGFLGTLVWTFVGWVVLSFLVYFVGVRLFGGQATVNEMLRVMGFAYAPQMLSIIPCIGGIIGFIWSLIAGFIAVRQGLDLDDIKTFFTVIVAFGVYLVGSLIINIVVGGAFGLFG